MPPVKEKRKPKKLKPYQELARYLHRRFESIAYFEYQKRPPCWNDLPAYQVRVYERLAKTLLTDPPDVLVEAIRSRGTT